MSSRGFVPSEQTSQAHPVSLITEHMKDTWSYGGQDDDRNDGQEIAVYVGYRIAQEISYEGKTDRPEKTADDIEQQKDGIAHTSHACQDRREGTDDRDEPGKDDRFRPVFLVEPLGAVDMLAVKEERVLSGEDRGAHASAEIISEAVSQNGSGKREQDEYDDVQISL